MINPENKMIKHTCTFSKTCPNYNPNSTYCNYTVGKYCSEFGRIWIDELRELMK